MLPLGTVIDLPASRRSFVVQRLIGEGSQGTVFEAASLSGARMALKWYAPLFADQAQYQAIAALIERGAPSNRFLWPEELGMSSGIEGFGYVMALRPDQFAGLADILSGKADVPFSVICRLGIELADSFLHLHSDGLCYRDISFGNVFFDPATGVPLICDNDNVGIDGRGPVRVLGTRRFMAPEIVRRQALPSTTTDLYSLAVLLFYLTMMGHPLVGRRELEFPCWDDTAESELLGRHPVFVFDPDDRSNTPDDELHSAVLANWIMYPEFIRELFQQAFTNGLRDPVNSRVRESVWRAAFARLLDTIVRCSACGRENFVHGNQNRVKCWMCSQEVAYSDVLEVGGRTIPLGAGTRLTAHHLFGNYDFDTSVAEVNPHPVNAELLGLRNLTEHSWLASLPDGVERRVDPGMSIRIAAGTTVRMASTEARITGRF